MEVKKKKNMVTSVGKNVAIIANRTLEEMDLLALRVAKAIAEIINMVKDKESNNHAIGKISPYNIPVSGPEPYL